MLLTETMTMQQSLRTALQRADLPCQLATRLGEPGLLVSTVDSFRGCEAEAVVYVTDHPIATDHTADYIAASRACSYLRVIGPRPRWDNVAYLMGAPS